MHKLFLALNIIFNEYIFYHVNMQATLLRSYVLPGCVMGGVWFQLRTREKCCESQERVTVQEKRCISARVHV